VAQALRSKPTIDAQQTRDLFFVWTGLADRVDLVIYVAARSVLHEGAVMSDQTTILIGVGVLILLGIYFLPGLIASHRRHQNSGWIWVLNLFLGGTGVAWLILLIWAFQSPPVTVIRADPVIGDLPAPRRYQPSEPEQRISLGGYVVALLVMAALIGFFVWWF
jgi:hypothetical protein